MGTVLTSRPATGLDDLAEAADVLTRTWLAGAPTAYAMRGDLVWWYALSWPVELPDRLRLWQVDGQTVGWSWFDGESLDYAAWSGDAASDRAIERAILALAVDDA